MVKFVERNVPSQINLINSISNYSIMKTTFAIYGATILIAAAFQMRAAIIAGPFTNPANGHDYYLLAPHNWTASEAEAETLGGTLAIIRNGAEQEWVFSKFGDFGGTNRNLWLGFHREAQNGRFISMLGEKMDYSNWGPGQPDNGGGQESCVDIWTTGWNDTNKGCWNDCVDWTMNNGVVEI